MTCGVPYTKDDLPKHIDFSLINNVELGANHSEIPNMTDQDGHKWWVRSVNRTFADIAKDNTDKDVMEYLNSDNKEKVNKDGNS